MSSVALGNENLSFDTLTRALYSSLYFRHFQANNVQREQSPDAESEILRQQRKLRPVSPHLTIYQPQLTWYMSSAHRLTGVALGGALYFSSMTYLCMPLLGYQVDSQVLVDHFGAAPEALKFSAKAILAAPFTYHISNGVRHLVKKKKINTQEKGRLN